MGNSLAYLALALWPFCCLALFRTLSLERALIWSILGGYLFLPPLTAFDLPLVPAMTKVTIPNVSVVLILLFALRQKIHVWPESRIALALMVGLVLCTIPTVLTNSDPITFEVLRDADPIVFLIWQLPGQSTHDIGSVFLGQILMIVPFLLARQFLATDKGLREILLALMVGALVYSIPSLIEIRLSPQLNTWIYGFFQHSFAQTMRGGGFRPIVFLEHGLWLALFVCTGVMAAAALAKQAVGETRTKLYVAVVYLFVLLVLCKSAASFMYGIAMIPLILLFPTRWQIRVAVFFGLVAVTYPMLRNFQLVPLDAIIAQADALNSSRADSLRFRFDNEERLLERAAEKPTFGWGTWGRNLIRNGETGEILTVPDGRWIIVFGVFGWLGYICEFGLLALPLFLIGAYIIRNPGAQISPWVGPLCLILGITMVDMLLNATLTPLTWLTAGAILGHAERLMPRHARVPKYAMGPTALDPSPRPQDGQRTAM